MPALTSRARTSTGTERPVQAQPFCQGTIRFSLGTDYEQMLTKVRLHALDPQRGDGRPGDEEAGFIHSHAGLIQAADKELAGYYATFPKRRSGVEAEAAQAVDAVVAGAFELCE